MSINIKNTPQHVLSVILCLYVIMSINIKNTPQHVLSVIICLYVIMSLYIKFSFSMYVSFVSVTYIKSGGWRLRWRRALSSIKKGVFLDVEGHVLEWRRACSWMGKDMFLKGVEQGGEASVAVRFCEIGWLNVSVGLCVFCSSVFFCEKENAPSVRKRTLEIRWGVPSLTKDIFFSHRAHRVHGGFWRTFRAHRTPSAYRVHRALLPKMAVRFCEISWLNVSVGLCVFCSSV